MGNEPSGCGCVSKSWYGCIRCGKESCDETTPHEHSGKYEERSILDDSGCQIRSIRTELQQAREEIGRWNDTLTDNNRFIDKLQQQLAQSQRIHEDDSAMQQKLLAEAIGQRDALQRRLDEAVGLLTQCKACLFESATYYPKFFNEELAAFLAAHRKG